MMRAAIGFRAKTGRAIAVALTGSADEPQLLWRREISLVDPAVPATGQPYHEAMELPWPDVASFVQPLVIAIENVASAALESLLRDLEPKTVVGIGVVGSPDRDLARLGNPHIRAHAAEGILFRRVLETAAKAHGIASRAIAEKEVSRCAIASQLKLLGSQAGPPWRADEKAAATAAWLMLHTEAITRRCS